MTTHLWLSETIIVGSIIKKDCLRDKNKIITLGLIFKLLFTITYWKSNKMNPVIDYTNIVFLH